MSKRMAHRWALRTLSLLSALCLLLTLMVGCTATRTRITTQTHQPLAQSVTGVVLQCSSGIIHQAFAEELRSRGYRVMGAREGVASNVCSTKEHVLHIDADIVECTQVAGSWSDPYKPVRTCVVSVQAQLLPPGKTSPIWSGVVSKRGGSSIETYAKQVADEALDEIGFD